MPSNFYPSANMGLPIPSVGIDGGPDYASNVNAALTLIDSHNHSAGSGVQITPAGININADLTFAGFNLTNARSIRLGIQSTTLVGADDLNCLNDVNGDLYFNDGAGNKVRITQSGGVVGSPGSISGLASPASATYVALNSTFVWQSAASTPANMDAASYILRNLTASSKGLTLNPPNAMASNYSITLPALPGVTSFLSMDASGNMGATIATSGGIGTSNLADGSVTRPKLAVVGQSISSSSGIFSTASTSFVDVTNLSRTVSTSGRPIMVFVQPDNSGNPAYFGSQSSTLGVSGQASFRILRDGSEIGRTWVFPAVGVSSGTSATSVFIPPSLMMMDPVAANSYTYKIQAESSSALINAICNNCVLVVYEL